MTLGNALLPWKKDQDSPGAAIEGLNSVHQFGWRIACVVFAGIGFCLPVFLLWQQTNVNLINIWMLNYQNHAGFYQQYERSYWKWLLVNPLEVAFAAGWPVSLFAFITCVRSAVRCIRHEQCRSPRILPMVVSFVSVWGLLWLTGKNSGEAARLWTLFLPWLICLATIQLEELSADPPLSLKARKRLEWTMIGFMAIQFLVCLLTVTRVSGFQMDSSYTG